MNASSAQQPMAHAHAWAYELRLLAVLANAGQPFVIGAKSSADWPGCVWLASTAFIVLGSLARLFASRLFPQHGSCVRKALAPTAFGIKLVLGVLIAFVIILLLAPLLA